MAVNINVPSQVKTYADLAAFPASGALKTIYIAEDTNKTYRWTGSVYVEVSAAGASGITIGTTAITSGTVGRVLFEGTGNVVSQSANLFWNETNARLGIGTSSPSKALTIQANANDEGILLRSATGSPLFQVTRDGASNNTAELFQYANGSIRLAIRSTGNFSYFNGGNFGFGTTTDAGFRLDVNGTARVSGDFSLVLGNGIRFGTALGLVKTNAAMSSYGGTNAGAAGTNDLYYWNGSTYAVGIRLNNNANVLINTTTDAGFRLDVNGTARVQGNLTITNGTFYFVNQYTSSGDFWISASGTTNVLLSNGANNNFGRLQLGGTSASYPSIKRASNNIEIKNANDTFGAGLSIGASLDASAILHADSTTKGFLPPRMTTTEKNAIASPATGLQVHDTTLNRPCFYDGTTWITL